MSSLLLVACAKPEVNEKKANEETSQSEVVVNAPKDKNVIATVGKKSLNDEEFVKELKAQAGPTIIQQFLIKGALEEHLGSDAKAAKDEALKNFELQTKDMKSDEEILNYVKRFGLTSAEQFKDQLYLQALMAKAVGKRVESMSEEELEDAYFNDSKVTLSAKHILVEKEDEAKDIIKQLQDGADFAELAKEHSLDGTKDNGGDLGTFEVGRMVPEFEEAVLTGENDTLIDHPVKTQFGYHVIYVVNNGGRTPFKDINIQEFKSTLKQQYAQDQDYIYALIVDLLDGTNYEVQSEYGDVMEAIRNAVDQKDFEETHETRSEPAQEVHDKGDEEENVEGEEEDLETEKETEE